MAEMRKRDIHAAGDYGTVELGNRIEGYSDAELILLREWVSNLNIDGINRQVYTQVRENWDHMAKPLDGLGQFETLLARIGAIHGTPELKLEKKAVLVMCADNGVVEEGISQSGQEVTAVVTGCMGEGKTSVGRLAACVHADVIPVDIGICSHESFPGVLNRKVAYGTQNFAQAPAMTPAQAHAAIETGIELVKQCQKQGYRLLATGEMGIGNTTTSSAMAAALTGGSVSLMTGRGAGLDDQRLAKKKEIIQEALERYQLNQADALRILCCVGGLDIAGLTGVFLGGAICHLPVVIDGVISAVAALTAQRLVPEAKEYMIPSHQSREPAMAAIMKELGLQPVIHADLALGEGSGAVMMFSLLDMALSLYQNQTTFQNMELEPYQRFEQNREGMSEG